MKKTGRFASLFLAIAAILVLFAMPGLATEDDGAATPEPISEEPAPEPSGLEPAVPIPDESEAEVVPDWTYRYLVPTGLALAVVVILITSIQYFTNVVRKRYRIVEE